MTWRTVPPKPMTTRACVLPAGVARSSPLLPGWHRAFHRSRGIPSRDVGTEVPTYDEWYDAFPFMRYVGGRRVPNSPLSSRPCSLVGTTIHEPTSVGTPAHADHMVECGDDITSPVPPVRGPHVVQGAFVAQGRACRVHASPSAALASEEVEEVFASDGAIEEVLAVHVNSSTKPNARSPGRESFLCANGDGSDPELAMKEELLLPLFDALWVDVVSEVSSARARVPRTRTARQRTPTFFRSLFGRCGPWWTNSSPAAAARSRRSSPVTTSGSREVGRELKRCPFFMISLGSSPGSAGQRELCRRARLQEVQCARVKLKRGRVQSRGIAGSSRNVEVPLVSGVHV